jgi:Effector Associated Constant Component 1
LTARADLCERGQVAARRLDFDLGPGAGGEELEDAAGDLLREDDVESVERVYAGAPPSGSRAVELAALASLVVTLGKAAVGPLAGVLQTWPARRSGRTVKLTLGADSLEISCGSVGYRPQVIETCLAVRAQE